MNQINRREFIEHIKATYQRCLQVLANKNQDYGKDDDPWANFKFAAIAGINVEDAIMVRILDKMARISNLLHKEAVVKDEKIQDTIEDAINYLGILLAWIENTPKSSKFMLETFTDKETSTLSEQGQPEYKINKIIPFAEGTSEPENTTRKLNEK